MRDQIARVRQFLGSVMRRKRPEIEEPLPAPPGPQEHAANVDFMAHYLFGIPANALGILVQDSGAKTILNRDGSRRERAGDA